MKLSSTNDDAIEKIVLGNNYASPRALAAAREFRDKHHADKDLAEVLFLKGPRVGTEPAGGAACGWRTARNPGVRAFSKGVRRPCGRRSVFAKTKLIKGITAQAVRGR